METANVIEATPPLTETWDCHTHFPYEGGVEGPCRPNNLREFIEKLREAGISRAAGNVWEGVNAGDGNALKEANRLTLRSAEESEGFIIPLVMVNPHHVEASLDELSWAHDHGIRMAGEICGYIINHKYKGKGFARIMEKAGELGIAVNVHLRKFAQAVEFAQRFSETAFIFPHFAGLTHKSIREIEALAPCENVCVDTSGSAVFRTGVPEHAIKILGPERVLFGTDYFIDEPFSTRVRVELACNDAQALELVMRKNLQRLIKPAK